MTALALSLLVAAAYPHPCQEDADRLCKGRKAGGGRIARCLDEHQADLSKACKDKFDSFKKRVAEVREACEEDAEKFCDAVMPGQGKIARCLRMHSPDLSPACKKDLDQMQNRVDGARDAAESIQTACAQDEQKLCPDVDLGGGKMAKCLRDHEKQLSPTCSRALAEPRP